MTFAQYTGQLINLLNTVVVPLIFALAFVSFIWGILQYFIFSPGDEEKRRKGRDFALWGILAMVLLFGIWGVVNLATTTLGF